MFHSFTHLGFLSATLEQQCLKAFAGLRLKFDHFVKIKNFDKRKIEILTGIIFLNMAAMHHEPFDHFIYNFGKVQINKWINLE